MAKRKQVTRSAVTPSPANGDSSEILSDTTNPFAPNDERDWKSIGVRVGAAMLAGIIVYAMYYPSDSIAVELGDALWLAAAAILGATVVWSVSFTLSPVASDSNNAAPVMRTVIESRSLRIDIVAGLLVTWMVVSAFATSPPGNLRYATNEAWLWITGFALFTGSRRLFASPSLRVPAIVLLIACCTHQAVHGLHQYLVSHPRDVTAYRDNPDRVLRMAGVVAPEGSAARMTFENRLLDGGPTGTFALANSLAGVLLVGFVLVFAMLLIGWRKLSISQRLVTVAAIGLLFAALVFTHSRSGVLAGIIGAMAAVVLLLRSHRSSMRPDPFVFGGGGVVAVCCATVLVVAFGKDQWLAQAPSSLAFRLQYWQATWEMVADHPWVGVGPGNFQAIYPQYRDATAAESIAEPHNFMFETLAAGGFVALVLLALLATLFLVQAAAARESSDERSSDDQTSNPRTSDERWWWIGAAVSWTLIWLMGIATGQAPDMEAAFFAWPVAGIVAWVAYRSLNRIGQSDQGEKSYRAMLLVAIGALTLHLCVSGGWTVPGVALPLWCLAAMMVPVRYRSLRPDEAPPKEYRVGSSRLSRSGIAAFVVGVLLLGALRELSLSPIAEANSAMRRAVEARQFREAEQNALRAYAADPWSPEAGVWLSELYLRECVAEPAGPARAKWIATLRGSLLRAGDDPAVIRRLASQPLHLYQVHGRDDDLRLAQELFESARRAAPTDAAVLAQLAIIAEALGDESGAKSLAAKSYELSELGQNLERRLWLQYILDAKVIGPSAAEAPVLRLASELLANQLDASGVARETE